MHICVHSNTVQQSRYRSKPNNQLWMNESKSHGKYHAAQPKNKNLQYAATWMKLDIVDAVPSEASQKERDRY